MLELISTIASKGVESISEAVKETAIKSVKESPLQSSMETIKNGSLESLKAQNEEYAEKINAEKIEQIGKNREDGANREELAHKELQREFPEDEGFKIEREQYLRDHNENIVKKAFQQALEVLPVTDQRVIIHLNPDDIEVIQASLGEEELKEKGWLLSKDDLLERGGCRVTTESSSVDYSLASRVDLIFEKLQGG